MNKDERSDVVGSKVDMNNVYLLKPKLRKLRIDYRVFIMTFARDVDLRDHYPLTTYLDLQSGGILRVYDNDEDASWEDGIPQGENLVNRTRIKSNPEHYLKIPGLIHEEHQDILMEFFISDWTDDQRMRNLTSRRYKGSIGKWKKSVDDEARYAYFDFRDSKMKQMAEEFLHDNRIEPEWWNE